MKEVKKIFISVDEDSLRKRKNLIRPGAVFDQVELLQIVTLREFATTLPFIKRKSFPGSNLGNKIGDVVLPDVDSLWQLTCKQKVELHGKFRVAVGGKTPGEEEGLGRGSKRTSVGSVEPVFWHARPLQLYEDLVHSYHCCAVVDLTAGDGSLAALCAKKRIPYVGFTLSDTHTELLKQRCITALLESGFTEGEELQNIQAYRSTYSTKFTHTQTRGS